MFELPDLVIELISEYLSYKDLLNLRLTCKKLKIFIDLKGFRRLNLFVQQRPCCYDLFYTNETISYPDSFRIEDFKIFNSSKFKKNFDQIQKLIIFMDKYNKDYSLNICLNELNHYTQLIHLEINEVNKIEGTLSLENLKICLVASREESFFELDCPNLSALKIKAQAKPKLVMKENNLTHLSIDEFYESDYFFGLYMSTQQLSEICFKRLKDLTDFLKEINQHTLNLCPLKQIELRKFWGYFEELDDMISNLSVLLKDPSKNSIKFFINNQAISLRELIAISDLFHKQEKKCIVFGMQSVDHDDLKLFDENPTILNCLLPNVEILDIDEEVELDEKLMSEMKNMKVLNYEPRFKMDKKTFQIIFKTWPRLDHLVLTPIKCEFFKLEELSNHFPQLKHLDLRKGCKIDNFYFICNLRHLHTLQIGPYKLEREVLNSIFESCSDLNRVNISGEHQIVYFEIKKKTEKKSSNFVV